MMTELTPHAKVELLVHDLKKAAMVFRALNHTLRRQMLQLMHQNGKINVTDITFKLRLEQSIVSQHLAILRKAGLVETERVGKIIYYAVRYQKLQDVQHMAAKLSS